MIIKQHLSTINKSYWTNTMDYIIVHHTATWLWSIWGVLRQLTVSTWAKAVSCHYVIDTNWDLYKIGEDSDILWHAWLSAWKNKTSMNRYAIGIEVIGPLENWFTFEQRKWVKELVQELQKRYKIPRENVLRHADISPGRKVDIDLRFLNDSQGKRKYATWKEWQDSLK